MPRYEFSCQCGWHGLQWQSMSKCNKGLCPKCGKNMKRTYTKLGLPYTQLPNVDNHLFDNAQGKWDPGLGVYIRSRRHREQVMKEKGLVEVNPQDKDLFFEEWKPKPESPEIIADRLEKAKGMVNQGWKPPQVTREVKEKIDHYHDTLNQKQDGNSALIVS